MENFICVQCGAQFSQTAEPPPRCPICQDERQFVRHDGQQWTTLQKLALHHRNRLEEEAPRLLGIGTEPEFAIGQRALFLQSDGGNLLWVASRFSTARPLPSFTRAAVSAPSRSRIRIITRRWWNVRSDSIRKCFCTMPIASG